MAVTFGLPQLYPIIDAGLLERAGTRLELFAQALREAGIRFLQYRDKNGTDEQVLTRAAILRDIFPTGESCLILNDRVSLVKAAGFDGIHVGQSDLEPARVRELLGPDVLLGVSTHNQNELRSADATSANYLAVGPVFATSSKQNPDPVIGIEGVRAARRLTAKPLVAIGGITRFNCRAVLDAGADSVAVISDLLPEPGMQLSKPAEEFLSVMAALRSSRP
jgi:thiamine-phosphate pyrophosphorylase